MKIHIQTGENFSNIKSAQYAGEMSPEQQLEHMNQQVSDEFSEFQSPEEVQLVRNILLDIRNMAAQYGVDEGEVVNIVSTYASDPRFSS